eukprot:CAMPEP_0113934750 /NCGR_PEP_ID=MMETSP1339-20121228/2031_1 /TAXON_ID=94617 /ORGANISM="Fibrocapsa japonica" /LENGTH=424 /DNA_ID=CAMNT_0000936669 /DNA_START=68 /DNA_END=1339 /DNA_ORIENTATION=+ /assembly_acc=CAM_ASM_000762
MAPLPLNISLLCLIFLTVCNIYNSFLLNTCPQRNVQFSKPRCSPPLKVGSSAEINEEDVYAEVKSMRAAEIKKELNSYRISTSDCFEKEELVQRLVQARIDRSGESLNAGVKVPLRCFTPRDGVLGEDVKLDEKSYFAINVALPELGVESADFMIDTAATNSLVTPLWADRWGAKGTGRSATMNAGTMSASGLRQVRLGPARLGGQFKSIPLEPVVTALPIPNDIAGIVGLEFMRQFDMAVNFVTLECTFYLAGTVAGNPGAFAKGLRRLKGRFYPPMNMFGVEAQLALPGQPPPSSPGQPFPVRTLLDAGSAFSILNWEAASLVGLGPQDIGGKLRKTGQVISGASAPGQDFKAMEVVDGEFDLLLNCGDGSSAAVHNVKCCIGDLPAFQLLGLSGPAMVIGLDVLSRGTGETIFALRDADIW